MKVLVYSFRNKIDNLLEIDESFKNVKESLEMVGVKYTTIPIGEYDIIHINRPMSESKLNELNERNVPVVVSAFFDEFFPEGSFLEVNASENANELRLTQKSIALFQKVDLILVPNEKFVKLLVDAGIKTKIIPIIPGTNLATYDYYREDEKNIFYRYFKEDPNREIVMAIGAGMSNGDGINPVINAANKNKNVGFYYFTLNKEGNKIPRNVKKKLKSAPKNLHYVVNVPLDVYKSALINSKIYLIPGYNQPDITSLMAAMASRCQIVSRKHELLSGYIENEVSGYLAEYSETLGILIRELLNGEIKPTVDNSYEFVKRHSLETYGNELKEVYESLLK